MDEVKAGKGRRQLLGIGSCYVGIRDYMFYMIFDSYVHGGRS